MKIDCSREGNKGDIMAIISVSYLFALSGLYFWIGPDQNTFWVGFLCAVIICKWRDWIYKPTDKILDKIWNK